MILRYNHQDLRKSQPACWLPDPPRPSTLLPPSFNLWEHKQTLSLLLSFWEVSSPNMTSFSNPPPGSSHPPSAERRPRGHGAALWFGQALNCRMSKQRAPRPRLEIGLRKSESLRAWFLASPLQLLWEGKEQVTQTHTQDSLSNNWQGLGGHYLGFIPQGQ